MTLELMSGDQAASAASEAGFFDGFTAPRQAAISSQKVEEATEVLSYFAAGRRVPTNPNSAFFREPPRDVREAFSTSDFSLAAFAAIDTQTYGILQQLPSVWRQYTDVVTVGDFRPVRLLARWAKNLGLKQVPELTEYPALMGQDKDIYSINVAKYGLRASISFEAIINNEAIQEIQDLPGQLANAARETETINALANLLAIDPNTNLAPATAGGLNTNFFNATNKNAPANVPLTAENLDAALTALATRKSTKTGRVVAQPPLVVVIPQALAPMRDRIMSLHQIERVDAQGNRTIYDNYLRTAEIVVEPMLDAINQATTAATTWFILPKPGSARPASFAAFLRGHEQPDLRVKAHQGVTMGGGPISPREGGFEIDDIQYRCRHILGHQVADPTFTYVSLGA